MPLAPKIISWASGVPEILPEQVATSLACLTRRMDDASRSGAPAGGARCRDKLLASASLRRCRDKLKRDAKADPTGPRAKQLKAQLDAACAAKKVLKEKLRKAAEADPAGAAAQQLKAKRDQQSAANRKYRRKSKMIADPLHILEIVMPCAGGSAVVVVSERLAKKCKHRPVFVTGFGERLTTRCARGRC